jgi:hypothetical protein
MSAWAGYQLIDYRVNEWSWKPSLSYRMAIATGDDPKSARHERFDPLLSTGLGNWLQGVTCRQKSESVRDAAYPAFSRAVASMNCRKFMAAVANADWRQSGCAITSLTI